MTASQAARHEGTGEWMEARPGERFLIRIPAAQTNGAYSVVEFVAAPGDSTPVHLHEKEDEHFLILEGTARILYGDRVFDLSAGESVSLTRGIPHAWGNPTEEPLRFVCIAAPGGCEEALRMIAQGVAVDLPALAARFCIRNVGPALLG